MDRARTAVVVIAAVTGTVHCDATERSDATELSERPAEVPRARWATQWAEPEPWRVMELDALVAERSARERFDAIETRLGSSVSSTASGADGTSYVAGIFSGAIRVGGEVIASHGGDDVFLARILGDGQIAWARAVGSKGTESGAKVDFEDGRVKLVAMTNGAVDCGRGPLQTWDSEAFFLCTFGADGTPIDGATFPTGRQ